MPVNTYSTFVPEQLRYVRRAVLEQEFPEYMAAEGALIPISTEIPVGAQTYLYYLTTMVGEARVIANPGDDLPTADVFMESRIGIIRTIGDSYRYSDEDMEHAMYANVPLATNKAMAAKRAIMIKLDKIGYIGDDNYNLLGLTNQPNVPQFALPADGTGGSTTWESKTAQQIVRDLQDFSTSIMVSTDMIESPDTLLVDTTNYFRIARGFYDDDGTTTILDTFLNPQRTTGGITAVQPCPYLKGASPTGTNIIVAYKRREDKLRFHIPLPFTPKPPQENNLHYKVPCRAKTGGVEVTYPRSMSYAYGN